MQSRYPALQKIGLQPLEQSMAAELTACGEAILRSREMHLLQVMGIAKKEGGEKVVVAKSLLPKGVKPKSKSAEKKKFESPFFKYLHLQLLQMFSGLRMPILAHILATLWQDFVTEEVEFDLPETGILRPAATQTEVADVLVRQLTPYFVKPPP